MILTQIQRPLVQAVQNSALGGNYGPCSSQEQQNERNPKQEAADCAKSPNCLRAVIYTQSQNWLYQVNKKENIMSLNVTNLTR